MTEPSDEALMTAYLGGDSSAFAALFRRYGPRLRRLLSRDLSRGQDVEDLVQQTFLQLHRARRDFRPGARVRPWLYTIALNLRRQHLRKASTRREQSEAEVLVTDRRSDPEGAMSDAQVRAALAALAQDQRDVIVLHWFEGLSFAEVAEVVGASLSAVKVRAHRGYKKLRGVLEENVTGSASSAYTPREEQRS